MLNTGQKLAHFRIIRKLGEGGMGQVYLAEDEKLGREVAIKILLSEFFENSDRLERFTREARTAAQISHANVMAIYDIGAAVPEGGTEEVRYIVMEYVGGESLTTYLRQEDMSMSRLLRIAEHVASGLSAAHRLSIVHRDIKTDNIIIDDSGEPRILDFGLAKPTGSALTGPDDDTTRTTSQELTIEGKIVGTVSYMSPEQARGTAVDSRSDIFSFGVLLYRMFAGECPFDGEDRVSTIARILEAKHTPIKDKNSTLPPELQRIIDKCLQKNPDDRYQDTRDLVVDLRSLRRQFESGLSDTTSSITDAPSVSRSTGLLGRSGFRWSMVAVVVAAIAIIVAYMLGPSDPSSGPLQARSNALAILGFENKTEDPGLDWLQAGLPEILLTDLAQNGATNIISRNRVLDCLDQPLRDLKNLPGHKECVEAARSIGATRVLTGSFYRMGEKIRIDARMEDIESGQILLGEKVIGEDPFVLVDSLTRKIAQAMNIREMLADNVEVADITSSSPEAYREYILGVEAFSRSTFEKAIDHFQKAIDIDSTFALPYMRIGMAYVFDGRQQLGIPYFARAKQLESKLPLKDKSLLDIYYDTWFEQRFDDAFVKLGSYVSNYPDDKEARTIYALFLNQLGNDNPAAMAQLDTALMLDPRFQMALEHMGRMSAINGDYEKAIEYASRIKQYYPESPASYSYLAAYYQDLERYDEALEESRALLELEPGNHQAIDWLARIYVMKREFDSARTAAELYPQYHADDEYRMMDYYSILQNLAVWEGRFLEDIDLKKQHLQLALPTGDSGRIYGLHANLATTFIRLDMPDSAMFYIRQGYKWAGFFQQFAHALALVEIDRKNAPEATPLLDSGLTEFRARLPRETWPLADALKTIFDGLVEADTGKLIEGTRTMIESQLGSDSNDRAELGKFLVLSGRAEEALEPLSSLISGVDQTNNGYRYILARYYLGRAHEDLGDITAAVENYQEVLRFWNAPDIEIKEIVDTRDRLQRLTS